MIKITPHSRRLIDMQPAALAAVVLFLFGLLPISSRASNALPAAPDFNFHFQSTFTLQGNDRFKAPYSGANSLSPKANGKETFDATLYIGYRPWSGAEVWINPEIDQGFGLSNTLGLAGYSSGEAYKIGAKKPYLKLPRVFLRQNFDLGGENETVDADLNQFESVRSKDHVTLTVGKFGVPDIFDASVFAHDPRHDFLNWSVIDTGSFDYAADAWGYTYGASAEAYIGRFVTRIGAFDMSNVPNSPTLDNFHQVQGVFEVEEHHSINHLDGALRVTGFVSRARMASFSQVLAQTPPGEVPDTATLRRYRSRSGVAMSADQVLMPDISFFARLGVSDGHVETYEFTDIDRTGAIGFSIVGSAWRRGQDHVGLALVDNAISRQHAAYLAAGGLGPLIGDGALPHKRDEHIFETYYSLPLTKTVVAALDYQYVQNPAYNKDRGSVSILGLRLHTQY
ncbi:carbohydrate porin [Asticcacaulis sp. 201]|uniref:carbohydrate porin n=1 Tax=Asticcacaulis sp. 201 TaxID=3028787 RepID=UPI002916D45E|nr:carbohydrate porin [Asticcacaulis sp. 201]MDV6331002.1 carbohydrate porin [Asticcacaulis sp. 201]